MLSFFLERTSRRFFVVERVDKFLLEFLLEMLNWEMLSGDIYLSMFMKINSLIHKQFYIFKKKIVLILVYLLH